MELNRKNYAEWFIDYFDGKLSEQQVQKLMLFLDANPDCKAEFDTFDLVRLDAPHVAFPEKDKLKKKEISPTGAVNEQNYKEYFVLAHDNELGEKEKVALQKFLLINPQLNNDFDLFARLRLEKDNLVVYTGKAELKHQVLTPLIRNFVIASAAILLLFIGLKFFIRKPENIDRQQVVKIHAIQNRTLGAALLTHQEIKTALLSPPSVPSVKKTNRTLQNAPIDRNDSFTIKYLPLRKAYFSLREPLACFDLRFPKGKVVEEHINIPQPLIAKSKEKRKEPVARFDGLLANNVKKGKKNTVRGKGFVKLLDSGITVINSLSNSDPVILVKTFDLNGNLLAYQLIGDQFNIQRKIKRKQ